MGSGVTAPDGDGDGAWLRLSILRSSISLFSTLSREFPFRPFRPFFISLLNLRPPSIRVDTESDSPSVGYAVNGAAGNGGIDPPN